MASYIRAEQVVLPEAVPDPLEGFNRLVWALNQDIMAGLVKPTSKVYKTIARRPVRICIHNFGRNITYPGRLVNNLLEAKWTGARDETVRFACNSVLGAGGLFDLATEWKIPKSDADFGQTFGQWGWKPNFYLMLPLFGPSNDRDTIGLAADTAANPLSYVTPYPFTPSDPVTYVSPYTYCSFGVMYNDLTDTVDTYLRANETQMDAYSELEYLWSFARKAQRPNFKLKEPQDQASLETLGAAFVTFKNPEFPNRGQTKSVLIPDTGKSLKFTYWLQPKKAPIVYIVPGLGSHRLSDSVLSLAEMVFQRGFSAASLSSTFNYEFMEHASTADLPAYMPADVRDLHSALTQMDRYLDRVYPGRLGERALMGYSLGGFETLFLAATQATNDVNLIRFDRYIAINSPVHLLYGISKLDEFYHAPLAWPERDRVGQIENTFLKVAALAKTQRRRGTLPLSEIESKFLIGMAFRLILRDAIFSSEHRHNHGVLHHGLDGLKREGVYKEIMAFSYKDYLEKFLVPYYSNHGIDLTKPDALESASNLQTYESRLKNCKIIRFITNRNDFLLPEEDLHWLESIFSPEQLKVFDHGGHLGNLGTPEMQHAIALALEDLKR